jgi:hypothetical protein
MAMAQGGGGKLSVPIKAQVISFMRISWAVKLIWF